MNPYEANPEKIPVHDQYKDEPFYGRYYPRPDDFKPDALHVRSYTPESIKYWSAVLAKCNESNRLYANDLGGRDVFAVGGVIIKSSHLQTPPIGDTMEQDHFFADANEKAAIKLVKANILSLRVPEIYFEGKLDGHQVLVQERLPGVALAVAWQYLTQAQKQSFKEQIRLVLQQLQSIKPNQDVKYPTYLFPDPDPVKHRGIQELERETLFNLEVDRSDPAFIHNDMGTSNIIVDKDRIVGVVDWEMAGYFGWKTAEAVHLQFRCPRKEDFAALNLPQDQLDDILFWNDLYSIDTDE